jgi:hypothetical protein
MGEVRESLPRVYQFDIGLDPTQPAGSEDLVGIVKRNDQVSATGYGLAPLFGLVENHGPVDLVFEVEDSDDNGVLDAYAVENMRIGGASVANVTVPPGGKVVFILEGVTKRWLRFNATPALTAGGRLTVAYWFGDLETRLGVGTP